MSSDPSVDAVADSWFEYVQVAQAGSENEAITGSDVAASAAVCLFHFCGSFLNSQVRKPGNFVMSIASPAHSWEEML